MKVELSSGNVFADLQLDEPDVLLEKAKAIVQIQLTMEQRGLTVEMAANQLAIPSADLIALLQGDPAVWSLPQLEEWLAKLRGSVQ